MAGPTMKIIVTGGDGFCGWPTALHLSNAGHDILILDNLSRRSIATTLQYESLTQIHSIYKRINEWYAISGNRIQFRDLDLVNDYSLLREAFQEHKPDCVVHLAAQRSAPYSMMSVEAGNYTLSNNMLAANNVLRAIESVDRTIRLVHLGSIGVYGYEDRHFEIPEGKSVFSGVDNNGEKYNINSPIPLNPTSIYHLSKAQVTSLLNFYSHNYKLNITDLYQGIVWGTQTAETNLSDVLSNRFDYDEIYGTVLNRFVVQTQSGIPMTVYGKGEQTRAFIHIQDTVKCIEAAVNASARPKNDVEVIHQISETRTVKSVAEHVAKLANGKINHIDNPRNEEEQHRYDLENNKFKKMGLTLNTLQNNLVDEIQHVVNTNLHRIDKACINPKVQWEKLAKGQTVDTNETIIESEVNG
jgi:UDP-sulfoquinovose synthase